MTLLVSHVEATEVLTRLKTVVQTLGYQFNDELGTVEAHDLALKEYVHNLMEAETKRPAWGRKSPQIMYRRNVVDFVMKACHCEGLTPETTYHALHLIDKFMDNHDIIPEQLQVVAIACVFISGKLHEVDSQIPTIKEMIRYLTGTKAERMRNLLEIEKYVLKAFQFDIAATIEIHFLEVFLLFAVNGKLAIEEEILNNNNNNNNASFPNANLPGVPPYLYENDYVELQPSKCVSGMNQLTEIKETAFLILQEVTRAEPNTNFPASLVAASILMAARREHGLNFWTPALQNVTSYSINHINHCFAAYLQPRLNRLYFNRLFMPVMFWHVPSLQLKCLPSN